MIQSRIAHIEDFAAHQPDRRFQHSNGGLYQIAHVDEGAPLLAVVDCDHAFLAGFCSEQVDHQVEAGPVSESKNRGETEYGWMEDIIARIEESRSDYRPVGK